VTNLRTLRAHTKLKLGDVADYTQRWPRLHGPTLPTQRSAARSDTLMHHTHSHGGRVATGVHR